MINYFEVLGLTSLATDREIRDAYRRLAKRYHPDTNHADSESLNERMQLINEAKSILFDEDKRDKHRIALGLEIELQRQRIEEFREDAHRKEVLATEINHHREWSLKAKRSYTILLIVFVLGIAAFTLYELLRHSPSSVSPMGQIVLRHNDGVPTGAPPLNIEAIQDDSLPSLKHKAEILLLISAPDAPAYFEKCIRMEPENDTLVLDLARAWFKLGRYEQAFDVLYRRVQNDADRITLFSEFGDAFTHQERPLDAQNAYEMAMQLGDRMGSRPPSAEAAYLHAIRRLHELR